MKVLSIFATFLISFYTLALEQTYYNGKILPTASRDLSIIVTDEGYYPQNPTAFVGEKVRIFVTSTTDKPSCLILRNKEVFLEAKKGELSEGEVFLDRVGDIEIYCPFSFSEAISRCIRFSLSLGCSSTTRVDLCFVVGQ